jgi:hypothetical protein
MAYRDPVLPNSAVTLTIGTARRDLLEAEGRGGGRNANFGRSGFCREILACEARFRGVSPRIGM